MTEVPPLKLSERVVPRPDLQKLMIIWDRMLTGFLPPVLSLNPRTFLSSYHHQPYSQLSVLEEMNAACEGTSAKTCDTPKCSSYLCPVNFCTGSKTGCICTVSWLFKCYLPLVFSVRVYVIRWCFTRVDVVGNNELLGVFSYMRCYWLFCAGGIVLCIYSEI